MEPEQTSEAPAALPQVTLTLRPDGVAIRHNLKDVRLLTRMLAQAITAVNQEAPAPRPSILTGRFVPKVNGALRG